MTHVSNPAFYDRRDSAENKDLHIRIDNFNCLFLQEFLRFSELFMYALRLCFARSVAEIASVRSANLYEFMFGYNYNFARPFIEKSNSEAIYLKDTPKLPPSKYVIWAYRRYKDSHIRIDKKDVCWHKLTHDTEIKVIPSLKCHYIFIDQ